MEAKLLNYPIIQQINFSVQLVVQKPDSFLRESSKFDSAVKVTLHGKKHFFQKRS